MDADVPTSQQWIWFSTVLKQSASIEWMENNETKNGLYYVQKCYWGFLASTDLKKYTTVYIDWPFQTKIEGSLDVGEEHPNGAQREPPQVRKDVKMDIIGATKLFIAQEYIEPDFQGGPMVNHHLRDLAKLGPGEDAWIALKLDENVHYGQNGSGKDFRRWLVYHPPIARNGEPPAIFQHRFTGSKSANAISEGAELANKHLISEGFISDMVGKVFTPALDVLKAAVGHYLHHFLSDADVDRARRLVEQAPVSIRRDQVSTHLTALRLVETYRLGKQNAATDEDTKRRIQVYDTLKNDLEKGPKWYNDNIKSLPHHEGRVVYQSLVNTGFPLRQDADSYSQQLVELKTEDLKRQFGPRAELFKPPGVYLPQPGSDLSPASLDSWGTKATNNNLTSKVHYGAATDRPFSANKSLLTSEDQKWLQLYSKGGWGK